MSRRICKESKIILVSLLLLAALSIPGHSWGATAYVQRTHTFASGSAVSTSFVSNVTAASTVVVAIGWFSGTATLNSVTICGTSATLYNNPTTRFSRMALAKRDNVSSGACTITANFSTSVLSFVTGHEVSGTDTTDSNDGTVANTQDAPGTGTDAVTSTAVTTTVNGDYIFGASFGVNVGSQINAGTGFTLREQDAAGFTTEDRIQASSGSIAATFTNTNASEYNISMMMALKPSGGGGAVVVPRRMLMGVGV